MGYLLNLAASGSKGFDDVQQLRLQQSPSPDNLILVAHCYFAGTNNIASSFAYLIDISTTTFAGGNIGMASIVGPIGPRT
jgi:hypothetical protein